MKFFVFWALVATMGVKAAEKSVVIRFTPVTAEQYKSLLEANENNENSQRSDSRFISWSRLSSLASNFDFGKYLNRLFSGNRETKNLGNYPLCTLNAPNEEEGRQLDIASYPFEEYINSLNLPGDYNRGNPVINCVLVLDESKKKSKPSKRPTTTLPPPVYQPRPPPPHNYPPWYQPAHPGVEHPHSYPPKYGDHSEEYGNSDDGLKDDHDIYSAYYPQYPYPYAYMPYHQPEVTDDNDEFEESHDEDEKPPEHHPTTHPHILSHLNLPTQALQYLHLKSDSSSPTRRPRPHYGARPPRRRRLHKQISPYPESL
ncbi:uncharacterized protein LOC106081166 [Stomoxys calcitrans]|uniref:uncharacterized protein LOC106081166 n=1 Tax=Stomoxys calcitrans TaxID=35570 RepID=UPI0027E26F7B|nr:uncharacterized protein LOC106081166 [Stomoxys calcitrans]